MVIHIRHQWAVWTFLPPALGVVLAYSYPAESTGRLSQVLGWIYFSAWSVSFYPQVWLNSHRQTVDGLSLDFQLLNLLGFSSYLVYNAGLFWSPGVRAEYALRHHGESPAVHANDVFFAGHAAAVTAVTIAQALYYGISGETAGEPGVGEAAPGDERAAIEGAASPPPAVPGGSAAAPRARRAPSAHAATVVALTVAVSTSALFIRAGRPADPSLPLRPLYQSPLGLLYFLSYVKLGVTLTKYVPQLLLNRRLRSTAGWNLWQVVLDLEGGSLSLAQLSLDASRTHDWSAVTGNPVKFALGFVSIFFDLVFVAQHFAYKVPSDEASKEEDRVDDASAPLLSVA